MKIEKILEQSIEHKDILELKDNKKINLIGLNDNIKPYFLIAFFTFIKPPTKPIIIFTGERSEAESMKDGLSFWSNFFSKISETNKIKINTYIPNSNIQKSTLDTEDISRSKLLAKLMANRKEIFIIPIKSLAQLNASVDEYKRNIFKISTEQFISSNKLINKIDKIGYKQDETHTPGTFDKKGGIINVFPINLREPVRIEFFDNKIENIKSFALKDKKVTKTHTSLDIFPIKINHSGNQNNSFFVNYVDSFRPDTILNNPEELEKLLDYKNVIKIHQLQEKIEKSHTVIFKPFSENIKNEYHLSYKKIIPYHNNLKNLKKDILQKQKEGHQIIFITNYERQFREFFKNSDNTTYLTKQKINLTGINTVSGFQNNKTKTFLIFDKEILEEKTDNKKMKKADRLFIAELNINDFIVHLDHGIGIFKGTMQKTVDEGQREFLIIEYAQGDKLFLPAEYTDKITKYVGSNRPKINRLHEISWKEIRKKIKEDAHKQAKELLHLYAQRETSSGFIFSKDTAQQKDLENSFIYQETPDQLKTIRDIKSDMEGNSGLQEINIKKPMDRLVCGDVGFGKTEIALRAAFKATRDKKQVALLCPTTILAEQHFETFQQRLQGFNCEVEVLSRFKSKKEQYNIIKKVTAGKADIVIGTHRLLSEDIKFKDLGLIVIDEEQRFGVRHKEKLKKLRPKVDILTLSATPIPRTLNLALSKLKNISILETPPQGRKAIKTYILPHNDDKIIKAIRFELKRGGQVYYLHNRVATINTQLKRLKAIIPEAKFGIIHGQLPEKEIAKIMKKFNKKKEIDVLICSSIIENGLDLPNVNTIIVDNAVMFGLADLHQLRGRIGRGKKEAYAYFFYKRKNLKEKARLRLEALLAAKGLGAGFQIAMRDLEIRGAGNILGKQQSGNIKSVGLNLYCQLLNQAIKEIKTGKTEELAIDITIDLPMSAYIPKNLIPNSQERLKLYQSLAKTHDIKELNEYKKEIIKKYKNIPQEFKNLFKILELKILAKGANIKSIDTREIRKQYDNNYRLVIKFNTVPPYKAIKNLIKNDIDLSLEEDLLKIDIEKKDKEKIFSLLKNILIILKK